MISMTLAEVARIVGGVAHGHAVITGEAFVDTREAVQGGLFVAIAGQHVDGHDFAVEALSDGAAAVLGSRPTGAPTVVVDDVVTALGRLARHVVDLLPDLTVFALTGSQGKTGTKDFLTAILEQDGPTVATAGNFNNEIGVPLTVLRATAETRHLVVEMGARGIGHIAYLCTIAPPDVAAVLNVGTAHVGEFGSQDAIAQAKGEIVEALRPEGVAVLFTADRRVASMASRTRARVITWGLGVEGHDVGAQVLGEDDLGRLRIRLAWRGEGPEQTCDVQLRELGAHQALNASAAAAMALAAGVPLTAVETGLAGARSRSRWRMETRERSDGLLVINDAYNANPESMNAALETLHRLKQHSGRRTIAVLGEMYELGESEVSAHRHIGRSVPASGVDVLVTVGPLAAHMAAATEGHEWAGHAVVTASRDEALEWLRHNVSATDVVLVKASRGAALEVIADALLDEGNRTR